MRQVTDQAEQGNKVAGFYRLTALPAISIIEPVTGAKLRHWTGFVEAHRCAPLPCGVMPESLWRCQVWPGHTVAGGMTC